MRVILRFSLNEDRGSRLRNQLYQILNSSGIVWTGNHNNSGRYRTATYEGNVSEKKLRVIMGQFWNSLNSYTGKAHLDHFWMYCDKKDQDKMTDD